MKLSFTQRLYSWLYRSKPVYGLSCTISGVENGREYNEVRMIDSGVPKPLHQWVAEIACTLPEKAGLASLVILVSLPLARRVEEFTQNK